VTAPERPDEAVAEEILQVLRGDESPPPGDLEVKTLRKVHALITTRDLIDLTTFVFLLRFCAPLLDLVAALFGVGSSARNRRTDDE
jgi:hypothetical protein